MKMYYFYGCMNSAKSLNLLAKQHQFKEAGSKVLLLKPSIDDRTKGTIKTRAGLEESCTCIPKDYNLFQLNLKDIDAIFVDEAQFLTKEQVQDLWNISRTGIRVFCYGLKTNFKNELFEASAKLLILADDVEELKSKCQYCGNKATTHIKRNGSDEEIEVGDVKDKSKSKAVYDSVCQSCYLDYLEEQRFNG